MTAITFTLDDSELKSALSALQNRLDDMTPVMDSIGQSLEDNIRMALGRGETPWGEAMKPLTSRNGVPLNDTRQHIYNKITHIADRDSVAVGLNENVNIAATHQFGATIKAKNVPYLRFKTQHGWRAVKQVTIPKRPFLPIRDDRVDLPEAWSTEIEQIVANALSDAFK